MHLPIAILGAPSSIGIRPYDDGEVRRLDLAPAALREQGLVERLGARDRGDVIPPPYRDVVRPPGGTRNQDEVGEYSRALAARVADVIRAGEFPLVLGGDCSIVLGCLLGATTSERSRLGLVYLDAHADFATPAESRTGSAASMCLAMAVGRGETPLSRLRGDRPLVRATDAAVIGRRDHGEPWTGHEALRDSGMLDLPHDVVRDRGAGAVARTAMEVVARPGVDGFWIHLDADLLDPAVVPAVDSPEPGGLDADEVAGLLGRLVRSPRALGLELTIYDPRLDPDQTSAEELSALLVRALRDE